MNRISSEKMKHLKPLVESVVSMARDANSRMTVSSGSETRTNLMDVMIM